MKIQIIRIKEVDLKKLMKKANIKSYKALAKKAGINYQHFLRVVNGYYAMSEDNWYRIKECL